MATRRVCPQPGCPAFMPCATHARPNAHQRGYGSKHKRTRQQYVDHMRTGGRVTCWRCAERIRPDEAWDLGHIDRSTYGGPEHMHCNRSAAGKAAHEH